MFQKNILLPVLCCFLLLLSCNSGKDVAYKTDIAELGRYMVLNPMYMPAKAQWVAKKMGSGDSRLAPGPDDTYLVAILQYDSVVGKAYFGLLRHEKEMDKNGLARTTESWFPAEVRNSLTKDWDITKVYDATTFRKAYFEGWFFMTSDWKIYIYQQSV